MARIGGVDTLEIAPGPDGHAGGQTVAHMVHCDDQDLVQTGRVVSTRGMGRVVVDHVQWGVDVEPCEPATHHGSCTGPLDVADARQLR